MARPSARIIEQLTYNDITSELLEVKGVWGVTYKGALFNHRFYETSIRGIYTSYGKTFYTNKGSAIAQARNLNRKFNCEYFAVKQVYGE